MPENRLAQIWAEVVMTADGFATLSEGDKAAELRLLKRIKPLVERLAVLEARAEEADRTLLGITGLALKRNPTEVADA